MPQVTGLCRAGAGVYFYETVSLETVGRIHRLRASTERQHRSGGSRGAARAPSAATAQRGEAPQPRLRRRLTAQARPLHSPAASRCCASHEVRAVCVLRGHRAALAWCFQPLQARLALLPQGRRRASPAQCARLRGWIAPRAQQTPRKAAGVTAAPRVAIAAGTAGAPQTPTTCMDGATRTAGAVGTAGAPGAAGAAGAADISSAAGAADKAAQKQ